MSELDIISDFLSTIKRYDKRPHKWTIGITNDVQRRAKEHDIEWTFYNRASSVSVARRVEWVFLQYGCKGGTGGGHDGSRYVYLIHDSAW